MRGFVCLNLTTYFHVSTLLLLFQALNWNRCPETAVSWLKLYMQMASMNSNSDLLEPQFPQEIYVQVTRVCTMCI